jgi:hypothetical protein
MLDVYKGKTRILGAKKDKTGGKINFGGSFHKNT